jgi:hypothetical protein
VARRVVVHTLLGLLIAVLWLMGRVGLPWHVISPVSDGTHSFIPPLAPTSPTRPAGITRTERAYVLSSITNRDLSCGGDVAGSTHILGCLHQLWQPAVMPPREPSMALSLCAPDYRGLCCYLIQGRWGHSCTSSARSGRPAVATHFPRNILPPMSFASREGETNRYQPYPRGHQPQAFRAGRTKGWEVEEKQESRGRGM